jgi:hypothetical protein
VSLANEQSGALTLAVEKQRAREEYAGLPPSSLVVEYHRLRRDNQRTSRKITRRQKQNCVRMLVLVECLLAHGVDVRTIFGSPPELEKR